MTSPYTGVPQEQQYVMRSPSLGERLIAALTHLLILANLPGIFVTGFILVLSRRGSPYVRYHARSAMRWQFIENGLTLGTLGVCVLVIIGSGVMGKGQNAGKALDAAFAAGLGIVAVVVILLAAETVLFGIPAILGAVHALASQSFRYPVTPPKPRPAPNR